MEETPSAKTYAGWALSILAGLALLAALLLASWHLVLWLRDGIWPHLDGMAALAALGVPPPALPWAWVQSAALWILAWSAAFLLTCSSVLLFIFGSMLSAEHDAKIAVAKKARGQFLPAIDVQPAAPLARSDDGARSNLEADEDDEDDAEGDLAGEDDEYEDDLPPPPPQRTFRQRMTDNVLGCGCIVILFLVGFALFIGWDFFDRTHYNRVSAQVRTVVRRCVLEWEAPRDPAIWEKSGPTRSDEMACEQAERQAPAEHARVVETLAVTYSYTSPVDGRTYDGALHRDAVDFPPDVRAGGEMPVYSLKADPSRSRGIYQWPVD